MAEQDPIALGLPHRPPFVFIQSVVELEPGISATCRQTFSPEDPMFRGHFPGEPIVPGVILTEALAQTAGIAGGGDGRAFRLSAIRSMKFPSAAIPGEAIVLQARKLATVGGLWQFETKATVLERTVAEGMIVLSEA